MYQWRSWRISYLDEIRDILSQMWDEDKFALQWLETQDIYQVLDPIFIEENRSHKLSLKRDKAKAIVEDQEPVAEFDKE